MPRFALVVTHLWSSLQQGSPPTVAAPVNPTQIVINQPFAWLPTVASFLQFVLLSLLTFYIFRRTYHQKELEHQAEWYHRLVMDLATEDVPKFFVAALSSLAAVAEKVDILKAQGAERPTIDEMLVRELSAFKQPMNDLNRKLGGRLAVFSHDLQQSCDKKFQDLEDSVSSWFEKEANAKPGESRVGLFQVLTDHHSAILKLLRDYEFDRFS